MDGISGTLYICDPAKNKECRKTGCYFLHGGECFLTFREEYADTKHEHTIGELARKAWKIPEDEEEPEDEEDEAWTD